MLDLSKHQALGVWIYGDGQGELINFRHESPEHISRGAIADHYVMIDFKGWRYIELVETESTRYSSYIWPESSTFYFYWVYRQLVDFSRIESFSIWYNNVPSGKKVQCWLSPIKALPMLSTVIKNPSITVEGKTIVFPVEMKSGSYMEFYSMSDCKLYGPKGEFIAEVTPRGENPLLVNGINNITFSCKDPEIDINPRAFVTVTSYGHPF